MDAKYMNLVERLPLLPITNKTEHRAAKEMILELTRCDGDLSPVEVGYGKVLVQLIKAYESGLVGDFFEGVSGCAALEYLLYEHGMTQAEAAEIAGVSKQNLNDFLKGRRGLPKAARLRLSKQFKLDADIFELARELTSA
ncbi:MAG: helix-turn-helix domain-containing protein [Candidatus Melainabacteria bacterium]|nr:helix-turn-helix domain-containing protein [Candidatus Melainabacteria bacterium]